MAPEDLLLAARDVMRERGMARFTFEDNNEAVCLAGAVMVASRGVESAEECQAARALAAVGAVCSERYATHISYANDSCIADVNEACDVLEAAAKRAAQGGEAR